MTKTGLNIYKTIKNIKTGPKRSKVQTLATAKK